jgi:hypothetical protein
MFLDLALDGAADAAYPDCHHVFGRHAEPCAQRARPHSTKARNRFVQLSRAFIKS